MGLYDYLSGEQVKCFPSGTVYDGKEYGDSNNVAFSHIGGGLRVFNIGEEVPYRSSIYNYGKDFIMFDYRGYPSDDDEQLIYYIIHIIKDGKLVLSVERATGVEYEYSELKDLANRLVIDNFGNKLNIVKVEDIEEIVKEYAKVIDLYYKGIKEHKHLFNEYIEKLRQGDTEDKTVIKEYNNNISELKSRTLNPFNEKWLSKDNLFSNNIGYFIDNLSEEVNEYIDSARDTFVEKIYKLLEDYKTEDIAKFDKEVKEYKEWVRDYLTEEEINIILRLKEK